jgi:hypothetical protein
MQRHAHNASVWAFSALFGCISLFGPGWHYFVGHAFHASPVCHHGHCDDHAHAAADSDHTHEHESEECLAALDHEHDCPICSFFAQAQWASLAFPVELELAFRGSTAVTQRSCFVEPIGVYRSRAPPSDSPLC